MNTNVSLKYQLHDSKKSIIVYYCIIFALFFIITLSILLPNAETSEGGIGGIMMASVIFLFISGLNSFRETFRLFLQNGISRRALFIGRVFSILIISTGMAFIDNFLAGLGRSFMSAFQNYEFQSFFEILYNKRYAANPSGILMFFEGILFMSCLYAVAFMIGNFITIFYHRMNKGPKIAVSVGVPVGLFIVLPIVDGLVFHAEISKLIYRVVIFAFGLSNGANPYFAVVILILAFMVFGGLSWICVRKAVLKD